MGADAQARPQLKINRGDPILYGFTLVKRARHVPDRWVKPEGITVTDGQVIVIPDLRGCSVLCGGPRTPKQ